MEMLVGSRSSHAAVAVGALSDAVLIAEHGVDLAFEQRTDVGFDGCVSMTADEPRRRPHDCWPNTADHPRGTDRVDAELANLIRIVTTLEYYRLDW